MGKKSTAESLGIFLNLQSGEEEGGGEECESSATK